jgi:hypothetical protein
LTQYLARTVADAPKRDVLAGSLLALAATLVMLPRLASPQFGLLDDGMVPFNAHTVLQTFKSGDPGGLFTLDGPAGRFRPLYWLWLVGQYWLWGPRPLAFFLVLWLGLIATSLLVREILRIATHDARAGLLGGLAFVLSPPVVESYYTLSKGEPLLVLWLALSVLFLVKALDVAERDAARARRQLGVAAIFLLLAYLSKETAHAMLVVSVLWTVGAWLGARRHGDWRRVGVLVGYVVVNAACAGVYWAALRLSGVPAISAGGYSVHYAFVLDTMVKSLLRHLAFYVRDFPLLLILGGVAAARRAMRREGSSSGRRRLVLACLSWIIGWTLVMLPWRATFEYYLLPATLGASAAVGILLSATLDEARRATRPIAWIPAGAIAIGLALSVVVLINNVTNGRVQLAVDASNTALVEFLASRAPAYGTVLLNVSEPNEYVPEAAAHLTAFHRRPDLRVDYLGRTENITGAFVITPIVTHQPLPSVRVAVHEYDSRAWSVALRETIARRATLVYRQVERVPLLYIALDEVVCPLLVAADVRDGVYCGSGRPVLDRRVFRYGWEVYAVEGRPSAQLTVDSAPLRPGEVLRIGLAARNPSDGTPAAVLVGILLPEPGSARFVTGSCDLGPAMGLAAPARFPRVQHAPPGFTLSTPSLCGSGLVLKDFTPGKYTVFAALVRESALTGGAVVDPSGILAIDMRDLRVLPPGH